MTFHGARPRALVLAIGLGAVGCGAEQATKTPAAGDTAPVAGRVRGVVRLHGSLPARAFERVMKDTEICGSKVPVTRLTVGKDRGVKDAFVYLDGVQSSQDMRPRASVTLEQSRCEYGPHSLAIAAGTELDIVNGDPILHNVHARQATEQGPETIFNIAQPIRGQRTSVEPRLRRPGIVALTTSMS